MPDDPRTPSLLDDPLLAPRFARFLRIGLAVTAVFALLNVIGAVFFREHSLWRGAVILSGYLLVGGLSLRTLTRGRLDRAAQIAAAGTLLLAIPLALVIPHGAAPVSLVVVLSVTAVLGYVRGRPLRVLMVASVAVSVITGIIGALVPESAAPSLALAALRAVGPAGTMLVIFVLLHQYGERLTALLAREAHARHDAEEATRRAERLVEELKEAVTARDDFIAIASHELRTPLTSLKLQSEILARANEKRDEGNRLALGQVLRQTDRLVSLVDSLLDVTRITTGRLEVHREEIDLVALLNEVIARSHDQIERSGSLVTLHGDFSVIGWFDPARLDTAFSNLLGNALKYGARKPIDITVSASDTGVRVTFQDRGIGIPEDMHARIFDRFERAVAAKHYGGLGLGLWLVRQIVEAHGGTVQVQSAPEAGSTFTLEIPR